MEINNKFELAGERKCANVQIEHYKLCVLKNKDKKE